MRGLDPRIHPLNKELDRRDIDAKTALGAFRPAMTLQ
jgi:hypothetical protein